MNKREYLNSASGFIDYLSGVISGVEKFEHYYTGRSQVSTLKKPIKSLADALKEYKWPTGDNPIGDFEENDFILSSISNDLRSAYKEGDETSLLSAIDECLLWGDGYKKANLYKSNLEILKGQVVSRGLTYKDYLALANSILECTDKSPSFGEFNRNNGPFAMTAGITKVYALLNDDFIIYDSRVAAALGLFVTLYLEKIGRDSIDPLISFRWLGAKSGKSGNPANRNPSKPENNYIFDKINTHSQHAEWNVKANWVLAAALERSGGKFAGYTGQKALRAVEAALFMIGYDIPSDNPQNVSPSNDRSLPRKNSIRGDIYEIAKTYVESHSNEFSPGDLYAFLSGRKPITKSQIRSSLNSDSSRYCKPHKGIYSIR